jgi:hypothetical protein
MHNSHISRALAEACTHDQSAEARAARSSRPRRGRSQRPRHRLTGVIAAAVAALGVRSGTPDAQ